MSGFDINTVTVSGNLTRDPELRNLPSGQAVCSLRIAHNERFKDASGEWADRAAYFDVTIWSGLGEWMGRNLTKGQKVVVSGRLRWREWEQPTARSARPSTSPPTASSRSCATATAGAAAAATPTATPRAPTCRPTSSDFQPAAVGGGGGGGGRQSADDDIPF